MITINIDKAKEVTKNRLREQRKPLFESLDVEMMKNWNNQDAMLSIDNKKQALRDATKQVDTMTTIDELKAASLPVLE